MACSAPAFRGEVCFCEYLPVVVSGSLLVSFFLPSSSSSFVSSSSSSFFFFFLFLLSVFLLFFFFSKRFSVYSLLSCKTFSGLLLLFEHGPASDGQSGGLDEG